MSPAPGLQVPGVRAAKQSLQGMVPRGPPLPPPDAHACRRKEQQMQHFLAREAMIKEGEAEKLKEWSYRKAMSQHEDSIRRWEHMQMAGYIRAQKQML